MKKSFTLIELLVVLAIISMLATLITVSLSGVRARGRDSRRKFDLQTVRAALEIYYSDNKIYPDPVGYEAMMQGLVTGKYLEGEVRDPKNESPYKYRYAVAADKLSYELSAALENNNDPDRTNDSGNDDNRYEVGNDRTLDTSGTSYTSTLCPTSCPTE